MSDEGTRTERLISALEAQTNMLARLVNALDKRGKRVDGSIKRRTARPRNDNAELPTDVRLAVDRALKRFG